MMYFISDLHFDHQNVLAYDNRPWSSIEEMNTALIENINYTVKYDDELYILGDVFLHNKQKRWLEVLDQIKCKKLYLIRGNHDAPKQEVKERFVWVKDYFRLKTVTNEDEMENLPEYMKEVIRANKYKIRFVLSHFPMCSWDGKERGDFHLFGHVHINGHSCCQYPTKMNVGCMHHGYEPITIKEIFNVIGSRNSEV